MQPKVPVSVVTGSAGGIGRAVAETLLTEDPMLHCAAVDLDPGHADSLLDRFGDRVLEVTCDIVDATAVRAAMDDIVGWQANVVSLVNCAGIQHGAPSMEFDPAMWARVLEINLSGTFFWAQAAGRVMAEGGGGTIVNLSSVAAHFGFPQRAPYAASKAAVESLTMTLAAEWAQHGIRVNCIAPGYIETPLARESIESGRLDEQVAYRLHAMDRFGETSEIADAVSFLLSPRSSFITGETIKVDGGFCVRKVT